MDRLADLFNNLSPMNLKSGGGEDPCNSPLVCGSQGVENGQILVFYWLQFISSFAVSWSLQILVSANQYGFRDLV
jgi:hypothetical protein